MMVVIVDELFAGCMQNANQNEQSADEELKSVIIRAPVEIAIAHGKSFATQRV